MKSELDRFWEKVDRSGGVDACWLWTAGCSQNGGPEHWYGKFSAIREGVRKWFKAHRYSYELYWGPIGKGLEICHTCDNAKCVNPMHLFAATKSENMQDMVAKGRNRHGKRVARTIALRVRQDYAYGLTLPVIMQRHGLALSTVQRIVQGDWKPKPDNGYQVKVPKAFNRPVRRCA